MKILVSECGTKGRPLFSSKLSDELPLTTPQIPKSVVMGEKETVWQFKSNLTAEWLDGKSKESVMRLQHLGWQIREAYKVITPVPNSEPKETVEEAAEKYLQKYKYMGGSVIKPAFIDGANWQAQQQPVSKSEEKSHPILDNILFIDNASEALYEVIAEGGSEFNMLVCEVKDKDGNFYQLHIRAIRMDHADHISNDEEMSMYGIDEQYRLIALPQPPVNL